MLFVKARRQAVEIILEFKTVSAEQLRNKGKNKDIKKKKKRKKKKKTSNSLNTVIETLAHKLTPRENNEFEFILIRINSKQSNMHLKHIF